MVSLEALFCCRGISGILRHFKHYLLMVFLYPCAYNTATVTSLPTKQKEPGMTAQRSICGITLLLAFLTGQSCKTPLWEAMPSQDRYAWAEPTWGEVDEGLQCRLRPDKRVWQTGETPTFKIDIKNNGRRMFAFPPSHIQQICRIQFDGKWYHWPNPIMIDGSLWPLAPGVQFDDIPIALHEQFGIKITPGRHIIHVAFSLEGVQVVSNSVSIKVLAAR